MRFKRFFDILEIGDHLPQLRINIFLHEVSNNNPLWISDLGKALGRQLSPDQSLHVTLADLEFLNAPEFVENIPQQKTETPKIAPKTPRNRSTKLMFLLLISRVKD